MTTLRLCFVGPAASITLRRWVRWFADRGHRTTIVTVEGADEAELQGLHQIDISVRFASRKFGRLLSIVRLHRTLRQLQPDVVHVHYVRGLAWGLGLHEGYPYVATPWGSDILEEQGAYREWYSKWLTRRVLSRARIVTAHSAYMAERIKQGFPELQQPVRIGWGVDLACFSPGLDTETLRKRWNIAKDRRVVFSPRLAQPFYQHDRIIHALPAVCKMYPKILLVVSEQFADPGYVRELKRTVQRLDLERHVRFVGAIAYDEMPLWFNVAEIVVMLPPSDGMPNTLLESMACGAVPVLRRLPQYEELIQHEWNGWLLDATEDALVGTLTTALRSKETLAAMAKRNRTLIESVADQSREMSTMEEHYRQLVTRR